MTDPSVSFPGTLSAAPGHERLTEEPTFTAFRAVPRTGVIYVMTEAARRGYPGRDAEWVNLGQGQPETGPLPGAPARLSRIDFGDPDLEYAPVPGIWALREAVADHYNRLYRRGLPSQYSAENVCLSAGGRLALTRVAAALGEINLGHFLPDYTAYEELLSIFRLFQPIPILLDPDRGYAFSVTELRREITGRGLSALLLSNPANPTGKVIAGGELDSWVASARELDCTLLLDEFYSHYIWDVDRLEGQPMSSAAAFVEDVDADPVVILDGLTKNWRYPGWRVAWTVGPKSVIANVTSAGSFLDGGGSRPHQLAAIPLLDAEHVEKETRALRATFGKKRAYMLERLKGMGVQVEREPNGTFYIWGNVKGLPEPLNTGMGLFRAALERQVICVPGEFFDVNPGRRRALHHGRFDKHIRFSFGPPQAALEVGLDRLEALIGGR